MSYQQRFGARQKEQQRFGARQKEMSHQQRERRFASEKRVDSILINSINLFNQVPLIIPVLLVRKRKELWKVSSFLLYKISNYRDRFQ